MQTQTLDLIKKSPELILEEAESNSRENSAENFNGFEPD